jgi:acetyl esterase/lipase
MGKGRRAERTPVGGSNRWWLGWRFIPLHALKTQPRQGDSSSHHSRDRELTRITRGLVGDGEVVPQEVTLARDEVLLDDAIRLAARAAYDDDVAVTLDMVPGVPHVFQACAALPDEGEAALTRAGAFLREHTATVARK